MAFGASNKFPYIEVIEWWRGDMGHAEGDLEGRRYVNWPAENRAAATESYDLRRVHVTYRAVVSKRLAPVLIKEHHAQFLLRIH